MHLIQNIKNVESGEAEIDPPQNAVFQALYVKQKQYDGVEKVVVTFSDVKNSLSDDNFELRRH